MEPKRIVSKNLGRTQHFRAEKLYGEIKARQGPTRRCPFYGGSKYSQFDEKSHNVLNPRFPNPDVPIEHFDFALKPNGKWGLQAYCKDCYKAYRDARIGIARSTWVKEGGLPMGEGEIRDWYREHVGPTMRCSVCEHDLNPNDFAISRSMEKGLHNECSDCQAARAGSVRERQWLSEGDWASWTKAVLKMRKQGKVRCMGWPRSVAAGACLHFGHGRHMHADHIVPLRAGGINDAKNFQALCESCNSKKQDQLDLEMPARMVARLVGHPYKRIINDKEPISTIERKLKAELVRRISSLVSSGKYLDAIRAKKKEVNGQWDIERAYEKGIKWLKRTSVGG